MATASMPLVGLIANPAASKDIRRLVGLARVVDVEEKANLIARFLVGLTVGRAVRVAALDDTGGLVKRAVALAGERAPEVTFLDVTAEGTESDTRRAAAALGALGAAALATVGGDGTVRAAVEGWPEALLVPISAGTNNAVAIPDEPTIVGVATAIAVTGTAPAATQAMTALRVTDDGVQSGVALVDAVGVRTPWVGAGALWEPPLFVEAVIANARPTSVGIASIAAALGPIPAGRARYVRFGPGTDVRVPLGPGLVADLSIADYHDFEEGREVPLDPASRVVALDGERRLVRAGSAVVLAVAGPRLLRVSDTLAAWHGDTDSDGSR